MSGTFVWNGLERESDYCLKDNVSLMDVPIFYTCNIISAEDSHGGHRQ